MALGGRVWPVHEGTSGLQAVAGQGGQEAGQGSMALRSGLVPFEPSSSQQSPLVRTVRNSQRPVVAQQIEWDGISGSHGRPLHSADYDFNDELLVKGSSYWVELAEQQLKS